MAENWGRWLRLGMSDDNHGATIGVSSLHRAVATEVNRGGPFGSLDIISSLARRLK